MRVCLRGIGAGRCPSNRHAFCPISPKDDDSNTDDTKTGIDGSMDDSVSK